jgi:DNA end-binding protein Ku
MKFGSLAPFWGTLESHCMKKIEKREKALARPYWSGHIQISLVSFGVSLFPATEAKSEIALHQIDRKTGERIRHKNVSEDRDAVERADIIKGYEVRKGEYVTIEPEEIAHLRIPSKKTLEIVQFVEVSEIDLEFFEKPYFVVPESGAQAQAFAVIQKALRESGKAGLGEIAFSGREHLIALMPPLDPKSRGLMAYTMRYDAELRDPADYFSEIKDVDIDKDQLALAKELIRRNTAKFNPSKFVDDYEVALRELIDAKIEHQPVPQQEKAPKRAKVINLMDALRKSVGQEKESSSRRTHTFKKEAVESKSKTKTGGLKLVKPAVRRKRTA